MTQQDPPSRVDDAVSPGRTATDTRPVEGSRESPQAEPPVTTAPKVSRPRDADGNTLETYWCSVCDSPMELMTEPDRKRIRGLCRNCNELRYVLTQKRNPAPPEIPRDPPDHEPDAGVAVAAIRGKHPTRRGTPGGAVPPPIADGVLMEPAIEAREILRADPRRPEVSQATRRGGPLRTLSRWLFESRAASESVDDPGPETSPLDVVPPREEAGVATTPAHPVTFTRDDLAPQVIEAAEPPAPPAEFIFDLHNIAIVRGMGKEGFRLEVDELRLRPGERLALLGKSGTGKSTLLELLALALRPDENEVFTFAPRGVPHDVVLSWRSHGRGLDKLRARNIGYVPQTGGLLPFLSVRNNISLPMRINGRVDRKRVTELAERLEIADQLRKRPHQLSVGQRQRAAIARALVHRPAVLLADEPTGAVDPEMAKDVLSLLFEEARASGAAVVIATHDHAEVLHRGLPVLRLAASRGEQGTIVRTSNG